MAAGGRLSHVGSLRCPRRRGDVGIVVEDEGLRHSRQPSSTRIFQPFHSTFEQGHRAWAWRRFTASSPSYGGTIQVTLEGGHRDDRCGCGCHGRCQRQAVAEAPALQEAVSSAGHDRCARPSTAGRRRLRGSPAARVLVVDDEASVRDSLRSHREETRGTRRRPCGRPAHRTSAPLLEPEGAFDLLADRHPPRPTAGDSLDLVRGRPAGEPRPSAHRDDRLRQDRRRRRGDAAGARTPRSSRSTRTSCGGRSVLRLAGASPEARRPG